MYKVVWVSPRIDEEHGTFPTLEEAQQSVRDWWAKNNYTPYYIRQWTRDNITIWDYGSHSCFYHFIKED